MQKKSIFVKSISILITLVFFWEQSGICQDGASVLKNASADGLAQTAWNAVKLPYDLAQVEEHITPGSGEVIINIQDAHASLSAQYSISDILKNLASDYDLDIIALEGADGYINTSIFKAMPDREGSRDIAEYLMKQGRMSAGEFFSIVSDENDIMLYGVEDDALYKKNLESFRKIYAKRAGLVEQTDSLRGHLDALSKEVFSRELKEAEETFALHRDGKITFSEYWEKVGVMAAGAGTEAPAEGNIEKILSVTELEKGIDFSRATKERQKLLDAFGDKLSRIEIEMVVLKTVAFKEGSISPAEYHDFILQLAGMKGIGLSSYGELVKFSEYIRLYHSIDLMGLYREISAFEDSLRKKLYRNEDERRLNGLIRYADMLKRLFCVELSSSDRACLDALRAGMDAAGQEEFLKGLSRRYDVRAKKEYDLGYVFGETEEALQFYLIAHERDSAMVMNTLKKMRAGGKHVAALVTGGYHSDGMAGLLKSKNLSYLVVTPKFEKGKERPYAAVLTNKKKVYQKLLEAGAYQLATQPYCKGLGEENTLELAMLSIAREALRSGDIKFKAQQWASMYSLMHAQDQGTDTESVKGIIKPAELEKILGVGKYEDRGELSFIRSNDGKKVVVVRAGPENVKQHFLYEETAEGKPASLRTITGDEARALTVPVVSAAPREIPEAAGAITWPAELLEREKWEHALRRAWWQEELLYFAVPLAVFHAAAYAFGADISAIVSFMAAFRAVFYFKHKWSLANAPPLEYARRNVVAAAVAMLGVYIAAFPYVHAFRVPVLAFVPAATAMMMIAHFFANLAAKALGLEPAAFTSEDGKFQQFRYNPRKLEEAMACRKVGSREEIQKTGYRFTYANFLSQGVDPNQPDDIRLQQYTDIITKAVTIKCAQGGVKLQDDSFPRIRTYIHSVMGVLSERRRKAVLGAIEALMYDSKLSMEVVIGSIGALSEVDAASKRISFDLGVLKCLESSDSAEIVMAVAISHALFGRLGSATTDSTDVRTEMTLKVSDANHTDRIFQLSIENDNVGPARTKKAAADIARLFKEIRAYDEIPFTAFQSASKKIKEYGIKETGRLINKRYRPVAVLGEGGMGIVFLAYDQETGEPVAVKIVRNQFAERGRTESVEARFLREIKVTQTVESENVVKILDSGSYGADEKKLYYVMEYYPWPTIDDVVADEDISVSGAADIGMRVAEGLAGIHDRGIIHRDIKPANIMISPDKARIVIMDFGLTKQTDSTSLGVTMTGQIMGSPHYMAPEQGRDTKNTDHRADIYAAGVILYELLTGKKPFTGSGAMEILAQVLGSTPQPIRELNSEVDAALEAIVMKAMDRDPNKRYKTAHEFQAALEKWARKHGVATPTRPTRKARGISERTSGKRPAQRAEAAVRRGERRGARERHERPAAKKGIPAWIWGVAGSGILAAIIAIVVMVMPSAKKPVETNTNNTTVTNNTGPENNNTNVRPPDNGNNNNNVRPPHTNNATPDYAGPVEGQPGGAIEIQKNKKDFVDLGENERLANIWVNGGSVSFWCKSQQNDFRDDVIVQAGDKGASGGGWAVALQKNRVILTHKFERGMALFESEFTLDPGDWSFVTISYHPTTPESLPTITVNGKNSEVTGIRKGQGTGKISQKHIKTGTRGNYVLDELCLYGGSLTRGSVSEIYAAGLGKYTEKAPGLIAGYHFDEKSGDRVEDFSGNGNHGKIIGDAKRVEGKVIIPKGKGPGAWFRNKTYVKYFAWLETPVVLVGLHYLVQVLGSDLGLGDVPLCLALIRSLFLGGMAAAVFWAGHYMFNKEALEGDTVPGVTFFTLIAGALVAGFGAFGWVGGLAVIFATFAHWLMNEAYMADVAFEEAGGGTVAPATSNQQPATNVGAASGREQSVGAASGREQTVGAASGREQSDIRYSVTIGVPEELYYEAEEVFQSIGNRQGIYIAPLEETDIEGQKAELESMRNRNGSLAAALVDVHADAAALEAIVSGLAAELNEEVFRLANPEIAKLNDETVKNIMDPAQLLSEMAARYVGSIASLNISSSSLFEERIWAEYRKFYDTPKEDETVVYSAKLAQNKTPRYMVHYADGDEIFKGGKTIVPVGLEIADRRGKMGIIAKDNDKIHDKLVILAPEGVVTRDEKRVFRNELMDKWMLGGVLSKEDIMVLDRESAPQTTSGLHELVLQAFDIDSVRATGNTVIRCLSGALEYADDAEMLGLVQLDIDANASTTINSYRILVNLVLSGGSIEGGTIPGLTGYDEYGYHFVYLPEARPIDLNKEIRAYHEYLENIGVMA